ncbi:MAG: S-layer family protein [Nostoc sp. TH1S01]|nr:S-layer family protein [Nostoc sp. TH1S01]
MIQDRKRSQLVNFLAIGWALSLLGIESSIAPNSAFAQSLIVPDTTLGTENSSVIRDDSGLVEGIIGGAQRGQNLFHSFREFNVQAGGVTYFLPDTNSHIQNIITRVTGNNVSEILGTLGVLNSNANLFLMNPNGIIFGENARLDVRGSFVATTANAIGFGNQGFFSASERNNPSPLLTINPTAFLFNQIPKGAVVNRAFGSPLSEFIDIEEITDGLIDKIPGGLSVPDGRSLILLGGNVTLEGGEVGTFGGRVELGGLSAPGTVGINIDGSNFSLQFPQGIPRADVSLSNESTVYAFPNGGDITINARNLNVSEGSEINTAVSSVLSTLFSIFSGTPLNRLDLGAGEININTNSINLQGDSFIGHAILGDAFNQGGGIRITTGSLNIQNSGIGVFSLGQGNLGDVNIQASDRIIIDGSSDSITSTNNLFSALNEETDSTSFGGILVNLLPGAVGQGGDIRITTGSLTLLNGAQLNTTTFGSGNSGNIIVQARDNVTFDGSGSGISSFVLPQEFGSLGNGGDIEITTGSLTLTNGSQINTSTFGQGDGGKTTINARNTVTIDSESALASLVGTNVANKGGDFQITAGSVLLNNGQVSTLTIGAGKAGDVNIQTSDSFIATNNGIVGAFTLGGGDAGNVTIKANNDVSFDHTSGVITSVIALSDYINRFGTSGIDESVLDIISSNVGAAGDIDISARAIKLDRSTLTTLTTSGDGGDIRLQAQDFLLLRRGSSITAQAGVFGDGGNGGNITINSPFILAATGENTDIVANAFSGNGGRVEINAQGIFGLQVLNRAEIEKLLNNAEVFTADQLPTNDIVVFSQTNASLDGEVALNTPNVDPTQGLVDLPNNVVDSAGLIEQSCIDLNDEPGNQFIITGRGGLPASPDDSLSSDVVWSDTRLTVAAKPQPNSKTPVTRKEQKTSDHVAILPATGWVRDRQGKVTLVAQSPHASTSGIGYRSTYCQVPESN